MKNLRQSLEIYLIRKATQYLPKVSRYTLIQLSRVCGFFAYLLDYRGRQTAHENLFAAYRKNGIKIHQVRHLAIASYQTFALTFLDLFWTRRLNKDNYDEFFELDSENGDAETLAKHNGAIWVTPHYGNFELISYMLGYRGFPFTVVAQDFKNPALTEIFKNLREGSGHTVIPQKNAMLKLIRSLKKAGHAALLTDLNIKPSQTATVIDVFGFKTCVTTLHVQLAERLNLPMIAGLCESTADGVYKVSLREITFPPTASIQEKTQIVWNHFENAIRQHPEQWLWMYKHWRYLPEDDSAALYPNYANRSTPFLKLLRQLNSQATP